MTNAEFAAKLRAILNEVKMKNGNKPAYPYVMNGGLQDGLSKREYFAAMAMQGMLAASWYILDPEKMSELALRHTDALLLELDKPQP